MDNVLMKHYGYFKFDQMNSAVAIIILTARYIQTFQLMLHIFCALYWIDCVDGECVCAHGERLPAVQVAYRIDPPTLHILWNVSVDYTLPFGVYIDKLAIR